MDTWEFYFLELNPRLQSTLSQNGLLNSTCQQLNSAVAHATCHSASQSEGNGSQQVIEWDLFRFLIVLGWLVYKWAEIRRLFGQGGGGQDSWRKVAQEAVQFNLDEVKSQKPKGYVVAVRVTSEDPADGFKPTSGQVQELSFRSKPNSGGGIHEFSDSQFGHVFAFGETRAMAIANMVLGLKELHIRGEIRTNVGYTVDILHVDAPTRSQLVEEL